MCGNAETVAERERQKRTDIISGWQLSRGTSCVDLLAQVWGVLWVGRDRGSGESQGRASVRAGGLTMGQSLHGLLLSTVSKDLGPLY